MLSREMLMQIVALAPRLNTLRAVQLSSARLRLSPAASHEVRLRYRHLMTYRDKRCSGFVKYKWVLPNCRKDGPRITIGHNFLLNSVSYWINGLQHGVSRSWYSDGALEHHSTYHNGESHGEYRHWHKSTGQLAVLTNYVHGERIGVHKRWQANGILCEYYICQPLE